MIRNRRQSLITIGAGLLALVLVVGLSGAPGLGGAAPDRVTIGFIVPLTGAAAAEGNGVKEGAELAARQR